MLVEMRIRDLGVIDDAQVEFAPGFTAVTGETGAGKTMVVTSLGLLLGGRADAALVRAGRPRAVVEGRFALPEDGPAARRAVEAGAELDDGALLVSRAIATEGGRSRAHAGGRAVPAGLLGELAGDLVAVHGQSDQRRLLSPATQRVALDRYAGAELAERLAGYTERYGRLRAVEERLASLVTQARERAQEADLLRFGLAEVAEAEPLPGEDVELAREAERLAHTEALRQAAATAHAVLVGEAEAVEAGADAAALVQAARRAVDAEQQHDPALAGYAERLREIGYLVADVAADLAGYGEGLDADPLRLAAVEERRAVLAGLIRKYGADVGEVLAWAERGAARLAELSGDDEAIEGLTVERTALRAELAGLAAELTGLRRAAAERFAAAVTAELAELAMPHARVTVDVRQQDLAEGGLDVDGRSLAFGPTGVDEVELRLAAHPGAPSLPLAKGASGGELSRVMLAIEVVFAGSDPVPTYLFDEVDAGIGGKAAVEVGRRLARLAEHAQVVVVTHLPQVAAFADRHLVVTKSGDGRVTRSGVRALAEADRPRELSRMLAGLEDSELGRAHAEELLRTARAGR